MKNIYFRVITVVINLYFTGTMTNPSGKSSFLLSSECQWSGYLQTNCSSPAKHGKPMSRSQTADSDVNFRGFRVLLQSHTNKEEWKIKHLDLSNNLISKMAFSPLTHLRALEVLNLSNNAIHSVSLDLPGPHSSQVKHHRSSFQNGLPLLKVLILQRNQLSGTPEGLWKLTSLKSLDLSFNQILQVGPSDFHNCLQLENLDLKSNKIFKIYPAAFQDLKRLQVIDLSNNALTTLLPVMIIALEFPHLEVDLADNQWHCDNSLAVFQSFISESWREKWNVICNTSVGNKEAHLETPQSRISRETHPPHINLNHMKSLTGSKAERPQGGVHMHFSTWKKDTRSGFDPREMPGQVPRGLRNTRDVQAAGRREDDSQDLTLAVCLSVFLTFIVAFCLGAFTRPYVDRLWQQRCRDKSAGAGSAYLNEGFYDGIGAAESTQHPRTDLHHVPHRSDLYGNQDPFSAPGPSLYTTAALDRNVGSNRKEPGSQQRSGQSWDNREAESRRDNLLSNDDVASSAPSSYPYGQNDELTSTAEDHVYRNEAVGELQYETVTQEYSSSEYSMGISSMVGTLQTVPGSIYSDVNELGPSLSRETTTSLSKMLTHTDAQRACKSQEIGVPEQTPLGTPGLQMEFSKEQQGNNFIRLLGTQQPGSQVARAEEQLSARSSVFSDARHTDPLTLPQTWDSDLDVVPAPQGPAWKHDPSYPQCDLEADYDSDEGSLFTLSSESSEGTRAITEEEEVPSTESPGANQPPQGNHSEGFKDNGTSAESFKNNIPFQTTLEPCETQNDHFEKSLISGPDSGLYNLESASNTTNESDNALTSQRSQDHSPSSDGISNMFIYGHNEAPQPEPVKWLYSLQDLGFSNVDISPPESSHSAEFPSDPEERDCH
ncbi:leucine-rich repeat-containing protein 66 [Ctenodactylus gundi]